MAYTWLCDSDKSINQSIECLSTIAHMFEFLLQVWKGSTQDCYRPWWKPAQIKPFDFSWWRAWRTGRKKAILKPKSTNHWPPYSALSAESSPSFWILPSMCWNPGCRAWKRTNIAMWSIARIRLVGRKDRLRKLSFTTSSTKSLNISCPRTTNKIQNSINLKYLWIFFSFYGYFLVFSGVFSFSADFIRAHCRGWCECRWRRRSLSPSMTSWWNCYMITSGNMRSSFSDSPNRFWNVSSTAGRFFFTRGRGVVRLLKFLFRAFSSHHPDTFLNYSCSCRALLFFVFLNYVFFEVCRKIQSLYKKKPENRKKNRHWEDFSTAEWQQKDFFRFKTLGK